MKTILTSVYHSIRRGLCNRWLYIWLRPSISDSKVLRLSLQAKAGCLLSLWFRLWGDLECIFSCWTGRCICLEQLCSRTWLRSWLGWQFCWRRGLGVPRCIIIWHWICREKLHLRVKVSLNLWGPRWVLRRGSIWWRTFESFPAPKTSSLNMTNLN